MTATVELLGPDHLQGLRAMLARDAVHNLYLLGLLEEFGITPLPNRASFAYYGHYLETDLTAAVFVGGSGSLVVPSFSEESQLTRIAETLVGKIKMRASIGERGGVDALMRFLNSGKPRVSRLQRLLSVSADDLGPFTNPTLRLATERDLPEVLKLAAAGIKEIHERDVFKEDAAGFEARVLQRVRGRRTYVLEEGRRLVFKIDVGSRSQHGAELEGLYTVPDQRRKGHATLSLGQISRHLLSSLPRLTLRINDQDTSLAGIARKVGFVPQRTQRLVIAD